MIADEVISSIKTVAMLQGETFELAKYDHKLADSEKAGVKKGTAAGLMGG